MSEHSLIESGYMTIISEKLSSQGFEEILHSKKGISRRYIKIPQKFNFPNIIMPSNIKNFPKTQVEEGFFVEISPDSVPLSIFDTEEIGENKESTKHAGILSNIKETIDEAKRQNQTFVDFLSQNNLEIEDLIVISVNNSDIGILI